MDIKTAVVALCNEIDSAVIATPNKYDDLIWPPLKGMLFAWLSISPPKGQPKEGSLAAEVMDSEQSGAIAAINQLTSEVKVKGITAGGIMDLFKKIVSILAMILPFLPVTPPAPTPTA